MPPLLLELLYSLIPSFMISFLRVYFLDALDNRCYSHAPTNAQSNQRGRKITSLKLVESCTWKHRSSSPQRVPQRNRTAIDIHFLALDFQVAHDLQGDNGKRLVNFPQINIVWRHPG